MSAGSPSAHHTDGRDRTAAQTDRIARLFAEGQPAGRIALIARCTRARVAHVAHTYGWTLDAAGVLPRAQRPAVTPGRPVPARAAGMGPAPTTTPLPPLPALPAPAPARHVDYCTRPDCDNTVKVKSLGLCAKHYMAARRAAS